MDKTQELELFKYIYGNHTEWDVINSESPDFQCARNENLELGAEITDLYSTESDARLKKINGYALHLLSGGEFLHRDDKKNIKVDRVKYLKRGKGPGREINAIMQEVPGVDGRVSLLMKAIELKVQKVDTYLKTCRQVDLIINDASSMFWFDKYEEFYFPFSRLVNRHLIIKSGFREIFLVTTTKEKSVVTIPLKLSLFAEDVNLFERLIKDSIEPKKFDSKKIFMILFCCLYKTGYESITITTNGECIGLVVAGCHYRYSKSGKVIQEYRTFPEDIPEGEDISKIVSKAGDSETQEAVRLVEERQNYECCMSLFSEVDNV